MTNYPGIDYGLGQANRDPDTDIRYGVINMNDLFNYGEELEAVYAHGCPHCGIEYDDDQDIEQENCPGCGKWVGWNEQWGDEPIGWKYDDGEIVIEGGTDGDLFVLKSPWVANLQFCSPCAPGAGHMANPCADGPVCYVLPEDWFDDDVFPCPYVPRPIDQRGED